MQKKIKQYQKQSVKNDFLLKSLIDSDFLLFEPQKTISANQIKSILAVNSSSIAIIDSLELLKNLQQFIRVLQFLKKQKSRFRKQSVNNLETSPVLHICIDNDQFVNLIKTFLKDADLKLFISFLVGNSLSREKISQTSCQMFLLLNQSLKKTKNLSYNLIDKDIYLVTQINSYLEKNKWGAYKIYNELSDFKKIIFLLVIIHLVLTKN
jgi:hypothetical protein